MAELSNQLLVVDRAGLPGRDDVLRRRVRVRQPRRASARAAAPCRPRELVGAGAPVAARPPDAPGRRPTPSRPTPRPWCGRPRRPGSAGSRSGSTVLGLAGPRRHPGHPRPRRRPGALGQHVRVRPVALTLRRLGRSWLVVLRRRPASGCLGLFVTLVLVLLLGFAGMVLYTPVGPLVPALNSYWLEDPRVDGDHRRPASSWSAFVPAALFLIRDGYDRASAASRTRWAAGLPGRRHAGAAHLPAARVRVPDLDLRASSAARSGPRRPGAGTGAGTPRRSGRSSPGWSTPATCTPGPRPSVQADHRDLDRGRRLRARC